MTRYVVHTNVPVRELDPIGFSQSIPKMLNAETQFKMVVFKTAYACPLHMCYCENDRKIMCELESPDADALRKVLKKIELPFTAILAKRN
ncbi:MAG: hypothetical protein ABSG74_04575 [Candidatus Bathyarchaeia archaeon]|jgi:hypothetical protein